MLDLFSKHSLIDISLNAEGDSVHHVTEDIAIVLGKTLDQALGERKGIRRFGYSVVPMDDSLAKATIDLGGRPYLKYLAYFTSPEIEGWPVELIPHFFESLAQTLRANIHFELSYGSNDHHKIEAIFKAIARAVREAVELDPRILGVPSSKGVI
ncbi:MAG: imidazoleglycerol-phosphate dehydratase, partial [Candidatus Ranarchaeia archaeon]